MATYDITAPTGEVYAVTAPDSATEAEVLRYAQSQFGSTKKSQLSPEQISAHMKKAAISSMRGENPVLSALLDVGGGASSILRGGVKLASPELAQKIWPTEFFNKESVPYIAGQVLDPAAYAIGLGGVKAAQLASNIPRIGQKILNQRVLQGVIGGGLGGAGVGALSEDSGALESGLFGSVVGGAIPTGAKLGGLIGDVRQPGKLLGLRAKKVIQDVAGARLPALSAAWANAPAGTTAAQAAAGVGSNTVAALGARATQQKSQLFSDIADTQAANRRDVVTRIAGGQSQAEANDAVNLAKARLNEVTTPMRKRVLRGLAPLDTAILRNSVAKELINPEIASNRPSELALQNVLNEIETWTAVGGGAINPTALYSIRKNAVNSAIESFMGSSSDAAKKRAAAGVMTSIKPYFDAAIEKAGGLGWKDYLKTHEVGMQVINRMQLGGRALELLDTNPTGFVQLVRNNKPDVVRDIMRTEDDFVKAMSDKYQPLNRVTSELERDAELATRAVSGRRELATILAKDAPSFWLPNLINWKISAARAAGDVLENQLNLKTMDRVYTAMKSGKDVDAILKLIPTRDQNAFLSAMYRGQVTPYTMGGIQAATGE